MGIEYLLDCIKDYRIQYKALIIRAYEFALETHKDQYRKSGEPYIIHPLSVACILAKMQADAETICAGLLHDTVEDGQDVTKETIANLFGTTIANLVDGVTKMKKINFNNDKKLCDEANTRKIIETIMEDIRIFIIKLADRLHNMQTEDFQPRDKQIEHSKETMELYVPFANLIGAYNIMVDLEEYCFMYLKPDDYKFIQSLRDEVKREYQSALEMVIIDLTKICDEVGINFKLSTSIKSPYELFKKYHMYGNAKEIHDLYSLKINLDTEGECYHLRDIIKERYSTSDDKEKDYIAMPKSNMYRSLHTSIISPSGHRFQIQMQTHQMHTINTHGITAYWSLLGSRENVNVSKLMQDEVSAYPFFQILSEIRMANISNEDFNQEVKDGLLTDMIEVKTPNGDVIEFPMGATVVDFAYRIHSDIGDNITYAQVNGEYVGLDYELQDNDVVNIFYDKNFVGPKIDMLPLCKTSTARRKVKELQKGLKKRMNS